MMTMIGRGIFEYQIHTLEETIVLTMQPSRPKCIHFISCALSCRLHNYLRTELEYLSIYKWQKRSTFYGYRFDEILY
jgi:hypothetical protein